MGKITVSLGNPILIFLWSLALLLLGCAIGLHWKSTPDTAYWLATLGGLLMVIHDLAMGILWFAVTTKLIGKSRQGRS